MAVVPLVADTPATPNRPVPTTNPHLHTHPRPRTHKFVPLSSAQQLPAPHTNPRLVTETFCQPGTSVHKVHVNCISHVTLCHLLTHLGCVYNRSM